MAGKALEDIIGIAPLTEALRAMTSGVPDPFPAEFSAVTPTNRILGDRAKWTRIKGARTTGKLAAYGAPGRRVPLQPIASQTVRMLYVAMEFSIDVNMLARLQAFEAYVQDEGIDFIAYNLMELGKRIANTRIVVMASMLRYGAVYWDADGNILPSSAGAAYTYSAQVPANNQNQLNGIIAQPWSLPNTDVLGHIRVLRQTAAQLTGLRPDHGMYGINIPTYLQENSTLQPYLSRKQNFRDTLIDSNTIPQGFGDVKRWTDCSHAFFEDQNGVNQLLWNNDGIVFTPELGTPDKMAWWSLMEGSAAVLRGFDAHSDPIGALRNCRQEFGQSGWALPRLTPPLAIDVFLQDCYLPTIRNEQAPFQAVVVF